MGHYFTLRGLGRAVAYYPQLGIYLGNPLAGIFLSQLMYWSDKTTSDLGVYKTAEEWTAETGLSYRQQVTARNTLKELDILTETEKRLEHKIYFKFNIEAFDLWFDSMISNDEIREQQDGNSRTTKTQFGESQKRNSGATNPQSVIHKITTENTTESTTHIKRTSKKPQKFSFENELLKLGANKQFVSEFMEVRKAKKAVDSETAFNRFISEQQKSGKSLNEVLEICIVNSWKSFNASWGQAPVAKQQNAVNDKWTNTQHAQVFDDVDTEGLI